MSAITWISVLSCISLAILYQLYEAKIKEYQKNVDDLRNKNELLKNSMSSMNSKLASVKAEFADSSNCEHIQQEQKIEASRVSELAFRRSLESKIVRLEEDNAALNKKLSSMVSVNDSLSKTLEDRRVALDAREARISALEKEKSNMRRDIQFKVNKEVETLIVEKDLEITNLRSRVAGLMGYIKDVLKDKSNVQFVESSKSRILDSSYLKEPKGTDNTKASKDLPMEFGLAEKLRGFSNVENDPSSGKWDQNFSSLEKRLKDSLGKLTDKTQELAEAHLSITSLNELIKTKESEIKYWQQKYDNEKAEHEITIKSSNTKLEDVKGEADVNIHTESNEKLQNVLREILNLEDQIHTTLPLPESAHSTIISRKNSESSSGSDSFEVVKHEDTKSASEEFEDLTNSKIHEEDLTELNEEKCLNKLKVSVKSLLENIRESRSTIISKDGAVKEHSEKIAHLQKDLSSTGDELKEWKLKYEEQSNQVSSQLKEHTALEKNLSESVDILEDLRGRITEHEKKAEDLKSKLTLLENDANESKALLEREKEEHDKLKQLYQDVQQRLGPTASETDQLKEDLKKLTSEKDLLIVDFDSTKTQLSEVENSLTEEKSKSRNKEQELSELREKIGKLESDFEIAKQDAESAKNEFMIYKEQLSSIESKDKLLETELADLKEAYSEESNQVISLKERISQLMQTLDQYKQTEEELRAKIEEYDKAPPTASESRDSSDDENTYLEKIKELESQLHRSKSDIEKQRQILNRNFEIIREYKTLSRPSSAPSSPEN